MLQEATNHRAHLDVVGHSRDFCRQDAGAANYQLHFGTLLRGQHQGAGQAVIGQGIHLGHNSGWAPCCGRPSDLLNGQDHLILQFEGCHPQMVHSGQSALAGQVDKQMLNVGREFGIARQVADVGVQARGFGVVVARGQVRIALQNFALAPGDQQHLGMGFQANHAVHHLGPDRLQLLGPIDVGLFIKTRLQFNHCRDFFAAAHCLA